MSNVTSIQSVATPKPQTIATTAGVAQDETHHSVAPALHLSATYGWKDPCQKPGFDYSRSGNPTRQHLEQALADLEGAARGVVTATGMAAVDLPFNLVNPGELVLAPHDCYGGTYRLLSARAKRGHFRLQFVDQTNEQALLEAFAQKPKLVLIETPSNPLLRVSDIARIVALARSAGTITVADNTFLSPALQNPLHLGCDIVVHSTTKYINGHSDVVGGAVLSRDAALGEELAWWANCTGVTGAPFDSYLTLRGLRTLFVRLQQQENTAHSIAATLADDSRVSQVFYPGLKNDPGHEIASKQQKGFGAMLSVEFAEQVDTLALLRSLNVFTIAESLGGFESLVCTPATMTHASMDEAAQKAAGISKRLVRFSVGLEHEADLLADLNQSLNQATAFHHNATAASG
ncbi:cystathionine gamma-synthase [Parvularcula sp. IMCC14364]|uniref:cystathionine gamma-synthase n=1 Tax=Parvularcula sp. IMCC14364 TaxID=3067902 RepID=UPI0027416012|nr:cystathionine gamma-synthase [Parvularcula sp. IMCC14364]